MRLHLLNSIMLLTSVCGAVRFAIKPESVTPQLNTSDWPLLLKNYDKLLVRSAHFTPIPSGSSPLKRDLASYIKYAAPSLRTPHPDLSLILGSHIAGLE